MAASTITFNNASDVSVSFLTHRNLQMPVLKNSSEALEPIPDLLTDPAQGLQKSFSAQASEDSYA